LSLTNNDAVRAPVALGLKVTLIVQVAPAATLEPQLLACAKSLALLPLRLTPLMFSAILLVLVKTTPCELLVVPTVCAPNVRLPGKSVTTVPTPFTVSCCGLPGALSETLTVALRGPEAVGKNVRLMLQLEPGASVLPQLLVWVKSLELVPDSAILLMVSGAFPVFERLIACGALGVRNSVVGKVKAVGLSPTIAWP